MQNYYTQVSTAIAHYAQQIAYAAADSVVEQNDYCIIDNCYKMQFLFNNYNSFTNVEDLASCCLSSSADTAVRECMYNVLLYPQYYQLLLYPQ